MVGHSFAKYAANMFVLEVQLNAVLVVVDKGYHVCNSKARLTFLAEVVRLV